jgi:hypothetical protein
MVILQISVSKIARITGMSQCLAWLETLDHSALVSNARIPSVTIPGLSYQF